MPMPAADFFHVLKTSGVRLRLFIRCIDIKKQILLYIRRKLRSPFKNPHKF